MKTWDLLYRGSLSSCNYSCDYCPFAKTANTPAELRKDEREIDRFVEWVSRQSCRIGILFTPWGEALVHGYYRRALTVLSRMPQVYRVAIQTNLSAPIDDFFAANRDSLAFWATFHPSQTTLARFVSRCGELDGAGIRYSVGVVGIREHFEVIEKLRAELRSDVYLWINAFKRNLGYYRAHEVGRLLAIDPYFHWNLPHYQSSGQPCNAGDATFTVDGDGNMRRCHFLGGIIGNIYEPNFASGLKPRSCTAVSCGCHIGYVHMPDLKLNELYGEGMLERIPLRWPLALKDFTATETSSGQQS